METAIQSVPTRHEKDAKIQAATLLHMVEPEALEVYNTFTWESAGDKKKVFHERTSHGRGTYSIHATNAAMRPSTNILPTSKPR